MPANKKRKRSDLRNIAILVIVAMMISGGAMLYNTSAYSDKPLTSTGTGTGTDTDTDADTNTTTTTNTTPMGDDIIFGVFVIDPVIPQDGDNVFVSVNVYCQYLVSSTELYYSQNSMLDVVFWENVPMINIFGDTWKGEILNIDYALGDVVWFRAYVISENNEEWSLDGSYIVGIGLDEEGGNTDPPTGTAVLSGIGDARLQFFGRDVAGNMFRISSSFVVAGEVFSEGRELDGLIMYPEISYGVIGSQQGAEIVFVAEISVVDWAYLAPISGLPSAWAIEWNVNSAMRFPDQSRTVVERSVVQSRAGLVFEDGVNFRYLLGMDTQGSFEDGLIDYIRYLHYNYYTRDSYKGIGLKIMCSFGLTTLNQQGVSETLYSTGDRVYELWLEFGEPENPPSTYLTFDSVRYIPVPVTDIVTPTISLDISTNENVLDNGVTLWWEVGLYPSGNVAPQSIIMDKTNSGYSANLPKYASYDHVFFWIIVKTDKASYTSSKGSYIVDVLSSDGGGDPGIDDLPNDRDPIDASDDSIIIGMSLTDPISVAGNYGYVFLGIGVVLGVLLFMTPDMNPFKKGNKVFKSRRRK